MTLQEAAALAPPPLDEQLKTENIDKACGRLLGQIRSTIGWAGQVRMFLGIGDNLHQKHAALLSQASEELAAALADLVFLNVDPQRGAVPLASPPAAPPGPPVNRRRQPRKAAPSTAEAEAPAAARPPQAPEPARLLVEDDPIAAQPFQLYEPKAPPPPPPLPEDYDPRLIPVCADIPVAGTFGVRDCKEEPAQFAHTGLIGTDDTFYLAHTLDEPTATLSIGQPGRGKSYFKGVVVESALVPQEDTPGALVQPYCAIAVALGATPETGLEYLASVHPNHNPYELARLHHLYQLAPKGLTDQVILCLPEHVAEWRAVAPFAMVLPLRFSLQHLTAHGFNLLMGLHKGQNPLYMQDLRRHLRRLKAQNLATIPELVKALGELEISKRSADLALGRLELLAPFHEPGIDPSVLIRPGRLIHLAIPMTTLTPEDAQVLVGLALDNLALRPTQDRCPLIIDFDEAHTVFEAKPLLPIIDTLMRRRRHLGVSSIFSTHDARVIPRHLLAMMDAVAHFCSDDPAGLAYLREAISLFDTVSPEQTARLGPGQALFWARDYYRYPIEGAPRMDSEGVLLMFTRPRFSHHGGVTRKAVR